MTSNTSRNFEIWVEKNARRVEKKHVSQVEKKQNLSLERDNPDQVCCQSMSSLHRSEVGVR